MKITFIRSNTNAVGEYRVKHPMLALQALGHQCDLITLDKGGLRVSNAELAGDLLVLQRQTSDTVFELLDTLPADMRPKTVYEVDDNPWEWHSWDPIHTELGFEYGKRVREVMGRCDAVTCSTPTLAMRIRREFPAMPIWVVPNAIDYQVRDWSAVEDREAAGTSNNLVLGWTGSVHHTRDGQALLQALPTIFDAYPETLFLMQCCQSVYGEWTRQYKLQEYKDRLRWVPPLAFVQHPTIYSLFDINLAPLERTKFNACKSDLRLIEGGAHGVPYVASRIEPYVDFHRQSGGIGGYLASTPTEWVTGIANLLDGEREARGQSLGRYVRETRSLAMVVGQWQAAFSAVVGGSEGPSVASLAEPSRNAPCGCNSGLKHKRCCGRAWSFELCKGEQ